MVYYRHNETERGTRTMTLKDVLKAVFTFENVNAVITAALAAVLFMLLLYIGILRKSPT